MFKQFIRGGMKELKALNKVIRNESGNVLIISVVILLVIFMFSAFMIEIGRVLLVREQLQTATDSASLAAASSGTHRFVTINVITDRGQRTVCGKDECWCVGCNTVKISNIKGDERELLDQGGWQDFCVPECDCGGGDCWYEIVERDLMYDTHSMGWGTSQSELVSVRNELTSATRDALAYYIYEYNSHIRAMVSNYSLEQMLTLTTSESSWVNRWQYVSGYSVNCQSECYYVAGGLGGWKCQPCIASRNIASANFSKIASRSTFVERMINTMNRMQNNTNTKVIAKIDEQHTDAAGRFFNANLPKHAEDAGITRLKVYGYNERNSPFYPSVVVYAQAKIKTLFPQYFDDFTTTVCSQGSTSYRDAEYQKSQANKFYSSWTSGKWSRIPDDACWQDL